MKNAIVLTLFLVSLGLLSKAQSHEQGQFNISVGPSFGIWGVHYEVETPLGLYESEEVEGAVTITVPVRFSVGLADRFSLGMFLEPGVYGDDNDSRGNFILMAGLTPRLYMINGGKANWYLGLDAGAGFLFWKEETDLSKAEKGFIGIQARLHTGVNMYFSDNVGLFFEGQLGYVGFGLVRAKFNDNELDLDDIEERLKTVGGQFSMGLAMKF